MKIDFRPKKYFSVNFNKCYFKKKNNIWHILFSIIFSNGNNGKIYFRILIIRLKRRFNNFEFL